MQVSLGVFIVLSVLCVAAIFASLSEKQMALSKDYPNYAGYFSSRKFRRSFLKKIKLEEQIDYYKKELDSVNADVEFYIDYIKKQGGNK